MFCHHAFLLSVSPSFSSLFMELPLFNFNFSPVSVLPKNVVAPVQDQQMSDCPVVLLGGLLVNKPGAFFFCEGLRDVLLEADLQPTSAHSLAVLRTGSMLCLSFSSYSADIGEWASKHHLQAAACYCLHLSQYQLLISLSTIWAKCVDSSCCSLPSWVSRYTHVSYVLLVHNSTLMTIEQQSDALLHWCSTPNVLFHSDIK